MVLTNLPYNNNRHDPIGGVAASCENTLFSIISIKIHFVCETVIKVFIGGLFGEGSNVHVMSVNVDVLVSFVNLDNIVT